MSDNFFIENNGIFPPVLSKEEINKLFKEFYAGSIEAKEKIILHNLRLVGYRVYKVLKKIDYDKKELMSVGELGLIKAIETYDLNKGYEFSKYATSCIDNEIKYFMKKQNKNARIDSLDKLLYEDGRNIKLFNIIDSGIDIESEYIEKEKKLIVKEILEGLSEYEREVIKMYFGFYGKSYKQNEISLIMNVSQSHVSKLIKRILEKIRIRFDALGYDISSLKNSKKSK